LSTIIKFTYKVYKLHGLSETVDDGFAIITGSSRSCDNIASICLNYERLNSWVEFFLSPPSPGDQD
ncbi:hypothetical protein, partial [Caldisphaera sp.]|uniref:hypothetical protein n=1 Tax=Caldisphaera sp. TaxID=2060322 RepID=UPI003D140019